MRPWRTWRPCGVLGLMMLVFALRPPEGGVEPPEIAILVQLEEVRYSDEKMGSLLEAAPFLNDEQAVVNLLDHLRQFDCRDRKNFDTLILPCKPR